MNQTLTGPSKRILIIDALRGFALLGILIVHYIQQYNLLINGSLRTLSHSFDGLVSNLVIFLIAGKAFAIFSFLFGMGYYIQMKSANDKGQKFAFRFFWRLVVLLMIGFLHFIYYAGDNLIVFASLGFVLLLLKDINIKILLIIAFFLVSGLPKVIYKIIDDHTKHENVVAVHNGPNSYDVYSKGSFEEVIKFNISEGLSGKTKAHLGPHGRLFRTLALFIFGFVFAKTNYLEKISQPQVLRKSLLILSPILVVMMLLFFPITNIFKNSEWFTIIDRSLRDWINLVFAAVYVCLFILLYNSDALHASLKRLEPFGRMALTNYISQSIIGVFILYGFGLGLHEKISNAIGVGFAIIVFVIQMAYSKWWMDNFYYGPVEWLWRSLTYFKVQPFRRKNNIINSTA